MVGVERVASADRYSGRAPAAPGRSRTESAADVLGGVVNAMRVGSVIHFCGVGSVAF
jgi:hypothetical protein